MISQFFVLSQRGDSIVFRDYRGDVPKGSAEIFFRKVKFWKEDGGEEAPPVFNVDGVNYFHVKVVGLLFVATSRTNLSPSLVLELLQRISRVIKDYLGVLNEDSLRKNFVLVYELLDEVVDFGYVQTTSTEILKSYIFNEPIMIDAGRLPPLGPAAMFMQGTKRMPGTAITKSVVANEPGGRKREEIFVDIIEKISITFSSSGYILTSEIDGTIQMKSYLTGNPEIRLALNEDLSIGRAGGRSVYDYGGSAGSGAVILDDCNFHESVHLDSFDVDRTLTLVPPDGEFPVMNYRITQEFKPPFRINTLIEEAGSLKAEVILKIRAEFPSDITANTILVQMPLPTYTSRVSFELEPGAVGQTTDFKESNKRLEWSLKKVLGVSDHTLRAKLTFSQESHGNITKEAGPVSMTFTIPMYNPSRLQVKYLQIAKKSKTYNPYRWVRYVTQANSYVARI
ncbi:AP-4 complex subunit mu [Capsicum baccatum]|uniref:AP-4 complex subunit mu n=1 Tax=Capsicum baccatum TaxID=33114 RepID=A0A2G2X0K0_CAPBA|nr:AP-4 complex subunit mu [Capsicum baccatum]